MIPSVSRIRKYQLIFTFYNILYILTNFVTRLSRVLSPVNEPNLTSLHIYHSTIQENDIGLVSRKFFYIIFIELLHEMVNFVTDSNCSSFMKNKDV